MWECRIWTILHAYGNFLDKHRKHLNTCQLMQLDVSLRDRDPMSLELGEVNKLFLVTTIAFTMLALQTFRSARLFKLSYIQKNFATSARDFSFDTWVPHVLYCEPCHSLQHVFRASKGIAYEVAGTDPVFKVVNNDPWNVLPRQALKCTYSPFSCYYTKVVALWIKWLSPPGAMKKTSQAAPTRFFIFRAAPKRCAVLVPATKNGFR